MIPVLLDISTHEGLDIPSPIVDFADLPGVGEGIELDLVLLGSAEALDGHRAVWTTPERSGISLTVRSIYWQTQTPERGAPFMIPVVCADLVTGDLVTG
jgi:hypothetical protein